MRNTLTALGMLLAAAAGACTATTDTSPTPIYPVIGVATAGPTCPVMQDPPDPECDAKPVVAATLIVTDRDGNEVAETVTDEAGRFEVSIPAGTYTLSPQPVVGLLGTAEPQQFTAGPGRSEDLSVEYDTGIR